MIDWGSFPSWVTAITGLLALIAAGSAARFAYGQLRTAQASLDDRRDELAKAQASKVAAWLTIGDDNRFHAYAYNASDLPIYKTTVTFISPNNHNAFSVGTVGPAQSPEELQRISLLVNEADALHAPRIRLSFHLNVEEKGTVSGQAEGPIGPVGLTVSFTDAGGRRWNRQLGGDLTRVEGDFEVVRDGVL